MPSCTTSPNARRPRWSVNARPKTSVPARPLIVHSSRILPKRLSCSMSSRSDLSMPTTPRRSCSITPSRSCCNSAQSTSVRLASRTGLPRRKRRVTLEPSFVPRIKVAVLRLQHDIHQNPSSAWRTMAKVVSICSRASRSAASPSPASSAARIALCCSLEFSVCSLLKSTGRRRFQ